MSRRDGIIETLKNGKYLQDAIVVDRQGQQRVLELENKLDERDRVIEELKGKLNPKKTAAEEEEESSAAAAAVAVAVAGAETKAEASEEASEEAVAEAQADLSSSADGDDHDHRPDDGGDVDPESMAEEAEDKNEEEAGNRVDETTEDG